MWESCGLTEVNAPFTSGRLMRLVEPRTAQPLGLMETLIAP